MRRKAVSKVQNSTTLEKPVEVTTTSDGKLSEGTENATGNEDAAPNSAVAVVSKRGRRKVVSENVTGSKLDGIEGDGNKAITASKRGRKPANKNLGDVKDSNGVEKEITDDLISEKSNEEDLKVSDSGEAGNDVPKTKSDSKAPAKRGRKKADKEIPIQESAVENSNTEQEEAVLSGDEAKNLSSDESDFQVPNHSTKSAAKNTKKKTAPAKGKSIKASDNKDLNLEEKTKSNETEISPVNDDIHVAEDDAKSNPPSKRGRKRKNEIGDAEVPSIKQNKNSPPKSDVIEDDNAAILEEDVIEKPRRGRKAVKNVPTKKSAENAEDEVKIVPNPKERVSKRKVEKSEEDEKEKSGKVSKKEETQKKSSKKEKIPDVTALDFDSKSTNFSGKPWNFKISSWNINGIRAWLEKDGISYLHHEQPDILCVQETKCSEEKLPEEVKNVDGYHTYWLAGDNVVYCGVGILIKKKNHSVLNMELVYRNMIMRDESLLLNMKNFILFLHMFQTLVVVLFDWITECNGTKTFVTI